MGQIVRSRVILKSSKTLCVCGALLRCRDSSKRKYSRINETPLRLGFKEGIRFSPFPGVQPDPAGQSEPLDRPHQRERPLLSLPFRLPVGHRGRERGTRGQVQV